MSSQDDYMKPYEKFGDKTPVEGIKKLRNVAESEAPEISYSLALGTYGAHLYGDIEVAGTIMAILGEEHDTFPEADLVDIGSLEKNPRKSTVGHYLKWREKTNTLRP